jgi:hypothetical protein
LGWACSHIVQLCLSGSPLLRLWSACDPYIGPPLAFVCPVVLCRYLHVVGSHIGPLPVGSSLVGLSLVCVLMGVQERVEDGNRTTTTILDIGSKGHARDLTCALFAKLHGMLVTAGSDYSVGPHSSTFAVEQKVHVPATCRPSYSVPVYLYALFFAGVTPYLSIPSHIPLFAPSALDVNQMLFSPAAVLEAAGAAVGAVFCQVNSSAVPCGARGHVCGLASPPPPVLC